MREGPGLLQKSRHCARYDTEPATSALGLLTDGTPAAAVLIQLRAFCALHSADTALH